MTIRYKLTPELRQALFLNDFLGFDTVYQAASAIITHDDYRERWEITDQPGVIEEWRVEQLERNMIFQ